MIKFFKKQGRNILKNDPAAKSMFQAIWFSPSVKAIAYHRISNSLYKKAIIFWLECLPRDPGG